MKIGIIGATGKQGFALAKRLVAANYPVVIGSRSAERGAQKASEITSDLISGGSNAKAVECEIIILSLPFEEIQNIMMPFRDELEGKIIIDMVNNIKFGKYPSAVKYEGKSTYENIREWFPESKVVAMLKTVSYMMLESDDPLDHVDFQITTSDDAYEKTARLATDLGMTPVRIRGKVHAHTIERMVALAMQINKEYPGSHVGYQLASLILQS